MIKSDLEYLLDVVNLYDCEMSHRELKDYIEEAMKLKEKDQDKVRLHRYKDQDKENAQFTLTEDEVFNELN